VSNTLNAAFCVSVLEEALSVWGVPAIFNSDQGSQFTISLLRFGEFLHIYAKHLIIRAFLLPKYTVLGRSVTGC
jgi:hypothetical protein